MPADDTHTTEFMAAAVSIIIPALNAASYLPRLAEAIAGQSLKPLEVVVVDSASDDGTPALVQSLGWKLVEIERTAFDHGGTRNLGARSSSGSILVFMTQDALPVDSEWLRELVAPLINGRAQASFSRQLPRAWATPVERYARLTNYPERSSVHSFDDFSEAGIHVLGLSNVSSATWRREFERLGGFPDRVIMNEDSIYASKVVRAGGSVAYVAESKVWHSHDYGFAQQFRRYFDIGVSHVVASDHFEGAALGGAGIEYLKGQVRYLRDQGELKAVPRLLTDTLARASGYFLGRRFSLLPSSLRERLSMHRGYWGTVDRRHRTVQRGV